MLTDRLVMLLSSGHTTAVIVLGCGALFGLLAASCAVPVAHDKVGNHPDGARPPATRVRVAPPSEGCVFDAGVIMHKLEPRVCVRDDECEVFTPRTAFEALGCCMAVSRTTFGVAIKDPEFIQSYRDASESCGYLKVRCQYACEFAVCHQGLCRLLQADGGVNLQR
jgi:hypothetical protein